jgi:hypothetical protein
MFKQVSVFACFHLTGCVCCFVKYLAKSKQTGAKIMHQRIRIREPLMSPCDDGEAAKVIGRNGSRNVGINKAL